MSTFLPVVTLNRYKAVQLDEDYNLSVYDPEAREFRGNRGSIPPRDETGVALAPYCDGYDECALTDTAFALKET